MKKVWFLIAMVVAGGLITCKRDLVLSHTNPDLRPAMKATDSTDTQPLQPPAPSWSYSEKIEEAKLRLNQSSVLGYKEELETVFTKRRDGKYYRDKKKVLKEREMALAILDKITGEIHIYHYWLSEAEIRKANRLRRSYQDAPQDLPKFVPDVPGTPFEVGVRWWNYFNSDLWVYLCDDSEPDRYMVIANKYLSVSDHLAYKEDRSGSRFSEIVYVPFSKDLHKEELIERGRSYLNQKVDQAFIKLAENRVPSRAYPGKLVVETISPNFIKNIVLTEQTDPKWILESRDGGIFLTERVLARLGANGSDTFRFTYSKTGALGIAQIMPSTYKIVQRAYPQADLFPEVNVGRVDILNAVQASILVFDDHLMTVINKAQRTPKSWQIFNEKSEEEINHIRAAIYNGGPGKYIAHKGTISSRIKETSEFVVKYQMVSNLRHFDIY